MEGKLGKYLIFASKCLVIPHKSRTFALANKEQGALDEWLSLRSAKPSTAVRIRQAPPKEEQFHYEIVLLFVYNFLLIKHTKNIGALPSDPIPSFRY